MAASARSVRSKTAPDKRRPATQAEPRRPQLSLIEGGRSAAPDGWGDRARRVITWAGTRSTPLIQFVLSAVFLMACLLGSLLLRTQMVQNSFEASAVQTSISKLTQDVQDDQDKLDQLQASLPDRAQQMGMVPQQGTNSIDLNGYQPSPQMQTKNSQQGQAQVQGKAPTDRAGQR
ncbi:hypothetical protein BACT_0465 [Bifidobacterium actinocoloniiforme DSM 22766]|uniref:Cell division protein FtsL n=1 Tax=Bifidobacterium actinocoloniiforme DSM 22766 TaxID=1437605 RepID=A0A086YZR5_9BIFI|nr:hypothetical protein [Bifidobacterium actinocoloniiforme]KFI39765.1 hypothetical protein BACT_0465 [Bifidobacterium actinocoloniiforme DSM 22766]